MKVTKITVVHENGKEETWEGVGGISVASQNRKGEEPRNLVQVWMSVPAGEQAKS